MWTPENQPCLLCVSMSPGGVGETCWVTVNTAVRRVTLLDMHVESCDSTQTYVKIASYRTEI